MATEFFSNNWSYPGTLRDALAALLARHEEEMQNRFEHGLQETHQNTAAHITGVKHV
jgi:hypothetical protein